MTPSSKRKRGGPPKYTDEQRAEAVRLVQSGEMTARQAAEQLGASTSIVHYWVAQATPAKRKRPKSTHNEARAEIVTAHASAPAPARERLTANERDELLLLRAEVWRLRNVVALLTGLEVPNAER